MRGSLWPHSSGHKWQPISVTSPLASWLGRNVLPLEGEVRGWLRRHGSDVHSADDIIQEAYCRIGAVADLEQIQNARAYFYTTVRNILIERRRREKIVQFDGTAEIESLYVLDESPSVERVLDGRRQYELVCKLIEGLPIRCREVFVMRKVHQLTQRQTAERLGITENIVEKEVARGLKLLLATMADASAAREIGGETV